METEVDSRSGELDQLIKAVRFREIELVEPDAETELTKLEARYRALRLAAKVVGNEIHQRFYVFETCI